MMDTVCSILTQAGGLFKFIFVVISRRKPSGMCFQDSKLVALSLIRRGCSHLTPIPGSFKSLLWVGARVEISTCQPISL